MWAPDGVPRSPLQNRPAGCVYVGLDVSAEELALAPEGSYHDTVISDAAERVGRLGSSFDLIVSWQVLEHVRSLEGTLEALRSYLRPGGELVAFFSGRFSAHGLANLLVPPRAGARLVARMMQRDPDTVFPAYYDGCYARALRMLLDEWSAVELEPHWGGAVYFNRAPILQQIYVTYENWARRTGRADLATHYLLAARR